MSAIIFTGSLDFRNPGNIKGKIKKNWFQTYGQTIDPREEFHGAVPGFQPFDMTNSKTVEEAKRNFESLPFLERQKGATKAAAFGEGLSIDLSDIRRMILALQT